MAIEENNYIILQRPKTLKEDYSETILLQDNRYHNYSSRFGRLSVTDDIITRQYFDETGSVKNNQKILLKHLVTELLESLLGKANKHPGFSKMLIEIRQKYRYPGIANTGTKWVQSSFIQISQL